MKYPSAPPAAIAFLLVGVLLTSCSAASAPTHTAPAHTAMNDPAESVHNSSNPDALSIAKVDLCAWAGKAAAQPSFPVTVSIPEDGSTISHFVTGSIGGNTVERSRNAVKVRCDLLTDNTSAISLRVGLSFDPARTFTPPSATEVTSESPGPIELSGYPGYALLSEPLQLRLAASTYLDITVYNNDARYSEADKNFVSALLPVAKEMAAIWKSGNIPVITGSTATTASLAWADPSGICGAINDERVTKILGVASQAVVVLSNSGTIVGRDGISAEKVYCTYTVPAGNGNDPLHPNQLAVTLLRYSTEAEATSLFSTVQSESGACVADEVAIVWHCDGGNTSTLAHGGRLQPDIETYGGGPANVDTSDLHANIVGWAKAILKTLAEFSTGTGTVFDGSGD